MLANTLITISGVLVFLFIFWKRLKEDYSSEIIFKTATNILAWLLTGYIVSAKFFHPWFFYAEILGIFIGLEFSTLRLKIRFYETIDTTVIAFLPWLSFMYLGDSISRSSLGSFLGFLVVLIIIFFYYYMDLHYREFTWYKSGRVGFAGLSTLTLIFFTRSLLAIFGISVLSFVGKYEGVLSAVLTFTSLLALYRLSKK